VFAQTFLPYSIVNADDSLFKGGAAETDVSHCKGTIVFVVFVFVVVVVAVGHASAAHDHPEAAVFLLQSHLKRFSQET